MSDTGDDPLQPKPGSLPLGETTPFRTEPASSHNDNGSSTTSGLKGTSQEFDDGTVVIEATEDLYATRSEGLNGSLTGQWKRVQKGNTFAIRQSNYSYKNRNLPDGFLFLQSEGIPSSTPGGFTATAVKTVKATQFGKGDHEDEGTGSPTMGLIQTNSEVVGGSVRISIMKEVFGHDWQHNTKRLHALIEVFFAHSRRLVRVPLVDIGPGEHAHSGAEVDLTLACDQFLKTQGLATVDYRLLVPADS
jgi:hypothetical protein